MEKKGKPYGKLIICVLHETALSCGKNPFLADDRTGAKMAPAIDVSLPFVLDRNLGISIGRIIKYQRH